MKPGLSNGVSPGGEEPCQGPRPAGVTKIGVESSLHYASTTVGSLHSFQPSVVATLDSLSEPDDAAGPGSLCFETSVPVFRPDEPDGLGASLTVEGAERTMEASPVQPELNVPQL